MNIPVAIIIGIAVMLLLVISVLLLVLFTQRRKWRFEQELQQLREQQQNQLIEAAIRSEETERHRIAEQLHDEVGAILSSTRLHLANMQSAALDQQSRELHEKSRLLLDESISKVRSISHNLHSTLLKEFGLYEAIRHFFKNLGAANSMEVSIELDEAYEGSSPGLELGIYRILQELVNNILKHAGAGRICLQTRVSNRLLMVNLQHDGKGLSQEEFESFRYRPEGLGLKNIQNRINLLKGTIRFANQEKKQEIVLTIPIPAV